MLSGVDPCFVCEASTQGADHAHQTLLAYCLQSAAAAMPSSKSNLNCSDLLKHLQLLFFLSNVDPFCLQCPLQCVYSVGLPPCSIAASSSRARLLPHRKRWKGNALKERVYIVALYWLAAGRACCSQIRPRARCIDLSLVFGGRALLLGHSVTQSPVGILCRRHFAIFVCVRLQEEQELRVRLRVVHHFFNGAVTRQAASSCGEQREGRRR